MDLMKLQNLLNECIMIEQGNYLGGNFSVDLAEAQAELDQAKQLLIHVVVGQSEQLSLCQCDKPSPDIMYGKTCTECCLEIN